MHAEDQSRESFSIQEMNEADLDDVLAIEERSFPKPWSRAMFESELDNPVSEAYTLKLASGGNHVLAAYVVFWAVYEEAHILNIAVREDLRNRGLASSLLSVVLEMLARKPAVTYVYLEVRRSNAAARRLYEKFGFKEAYERKDYYGDEDAIVMVLTL